MKLVASSVKEIINVYLDKGEDIFEVLNKIKEEKNLTNAIFRAIGAVENPTIGFFDAKTGGYIEKTFEGIFELLLLTGKIVERDGKLVWHLHISFGDENYNVKGGHFISGKVGVLLEGDILVMK